MMRTVSAISLSGGQGKTTSIFFLGLHLALRGITTLWVDADPQHNLSLFAGIETAEFRTLNEVLRGQQETHHCLYPTSWQNLYIIPSTDSLAGVNEFLASTGNASRILARRLKPVAEAFDVCLIDAPPSRSQIVISVAGASDQVLIPFEVNVKGTNCLINSIQFLKDLADMDAWSGQIIGALPFRDKWFGFNQLKDGKENLEAAKSFLNNAIPMFPAILESAQFRTAIRQGVTLSQLGYPNLDLPFLQILSILEIGNYVTA
jgi:chromosome partitioning protein